MDEFQVLDESKLPAPFPMGNTGVICYLNSLLQGLMSCTSFADELLTYENDTTITDTAKIMIEFIKAVRSNINPHIYSAKILKVLKADLARNNAGKRFGNQQESASEGFIYILDMINIGSVSRLFINRTRLTLYCVNCKNEVSTTTDISPQYEYFANTTSLTPDEFSEFFRHQSCIVEDYTCEKCKKKGKALRSQQLIMLPEILFVVMNKYYQKSKKYIPHEFTMPQRDGGIIKYKLVSIINHSGSLGGGHYTAQALRQGGIYNCNDMTISNMSGFQNEENTYICIFHLY
ncbi:MAG: hypothetical protein KAS12_01430 [Candidatus Aenigmarchaeota archaeon]|nr:hypothetical protein [Candidatus Aenigmarchaeota archaeon]